MPPLVEELPPLLTTDALGRSVRGFDTVGSTNTEALRWAEDGAPEGSVVYAEYQSAGRGRQGRTWTATAGQNLMLSVILRPLFPPERFSLVTLAGGVAVADAVAEVCTPLDVHIKWPNDVLIEGRKCCGMLLEASTDSTASVVVLGIGLNVNQDTFPESLDEHATSLRLETGRTIARAPLLADLLARLERWYASIHEDGGQALRAAYADRLRMMGQTVTLRVTDLQEPVEGTVVGLDETGSLRLRTDEGLHTFHAGDVTLQPTSNA